MTRAAAASSLSWIGGAAARVRDIGNLDAFPGDAGPVDFLLLRTAMQPAGLEATREITASAAFLAARAGGLLRVARREVFLTPAGAARVGLSPSAAHDPSSWPGPDRVRFYLQGFCHVLAVALHRMTDLGLVAVRTADPGFTAPDGSCGVVHVGVRLPGGGILDATACPHGAGFRLEFTETHLEDIGDEGGLAAFVGELSHLCPYAEEDVAQAARFAGEILAARAERLDRFPAAS